jgi:DNA-binding MarR family transcriptional regulator
MASATTALETPEALSSAPGDLALLLAAVERKVSGRLAAVLESAGSTVEQWRVLSLLADGRGHPMTEVAEYALLPTPTLTKVIDRMVAANLVHRRPDGIDRRRVLALLTRRGRTVHRSLSQAIQQEEEQLLALLDGKADPLHMLLTHVNEQLS